MNYVDRTHCNAGPTPTCLGLKGYYVVVVILTVMQQIVYTKCRSVLISVLDGLALLIKLYSHYIYICLKIKNL